VRGRAGVAAAGYSAGPVGSRAVSRSHRMAVPRAAWVVWVVWLGTAIRAPAVSIHGSESRSGKHVGRSQLQTLGVPRGVGVARRRIIL
jgi:hypothetical protein